MSLDSRLVKLEFRDVEQAFAQAEEGKPALLSFSNHDFRDMREEVTYAQGLIRRAAGKYPDVTFHFCNAIEAMQKVEHLVPEYAELELTVHFDKEKDTGMFHVKAQKKIFGTQPWLCFENV